jgi:protein-S-isoprenylcysteine O-methyltransferase Ste14
MTRLQSRTRLTRAQKRACPATRADHVWTSLVFALCFLLAVALALAICLPEHAPLASRIGETASWIALLIAAVLLMLVLFVILSFGAQWEFNFAYRDLRDFMHAQGVAHLFEEIGAWRRSRRIRATPDR